MSDQASSKELIVETIDDVLVVRFPSVPLFGEEIVAETSRTLSALAANLTAKAMVLNFSNVELIASRGLGEVMALYKKLGKKVLVCGLSPKLSELFTIVFLDQLLDIYPTEGEAIEAGRQAPDDE